MALDEHGGAIVADFPEDFNKGLAAQAQADNTRRLEWYNRACDNAQISIDAGRGDTVSWPNTPTKMEPSAPDAEGVIYWRDFGRPLVDPPRKPVLKQQLGSALAGSSLNPALPPGVLDLGPARGNGFSCGPNDTNPVGKVITLPDGRKIVKTNWGVFGFFYEFTN